MFKNVHSLLDVFSCGRTKKEWKRKFALLSYLSMSMRDHFNFILLRVSREFNRRDIICISLEFRVLSRFCAPLPFIHLRARVRVCAIADGNHDADHKEVTRLRGASL